MMSVNVNELDESQVLEMAVNETEKIGYRLIAMRKLKEESNDYLRYVLAYNENKEEYAVWMLNVSMGGLHLGDYFNHWYKSKDEAEKNAIERFNSR